MSTHFHAWESGSGSVSRRCLPVVSSRALTWSGGAGHKIPVMHGDNSSKRDEGGCGGRADLTDLSHVLSHRSDKWSRVVRRHREGGGQSSVLNGILWHSGMPEPSANSKKETLVATLLRLRQTDR